MADASGTHAPAERVIARLRPHARRLFWPSLALIAIATAVGYYQDAVPEPWEAVLLYVSAAFLTLLLFLLPLVSWLSCRYTVTTRRLILRRGLFVRVRQELLHSRGYDVSMSRGPLQTLFRSGTVRINSGLERPVLMKDVPRAHLVQDALHDLMENSQNSLAALRGQWESVPEADTRAFGRR